MSSKLSLYSDDGQDFCADYDLKDKLGEGVFSDVWLCVHRRNEKKFAAKILKKRYEWTSNTVQWNTISEVMVASSLEKHPFLLTMEAVYHIIECGKIILITELMEKSLYDVIEESQCPVPDSRIKSYMYQMLEGLKYLHESGFIHRDIKPENILLTSSDRLLKIGDFGTAGNITDSRPYTEYVATRWYRPPECVLTRGWYGTKMDIWAAGCVLYEMATLRPLFDGRDENEQMQKIDRVLGSPSYGMISKFEKYKSDLLVTRYDTGNRSEWVVTVGVGLHAVYQSFRPAYELLKEMIVYDPNKRFSAGQLLRKPYFNDMKNTRYEYKIKKFRAMVKRNNAAVSGWCTGEGSLNTTKNNCRSMSETQKSCGDSVSQDKTIGQYGYKDRTQERHRDIRNRNVHEQCSKIDGVDDRLKSTDNKYPEYGKPKANINANFLANNPLAISTLDKASIVKSNSSVQKRPPFK